ncbi:methylmalonyl-CoA mutase subunit beta [Nonomuraea africana]|uniref:Methylmalonyl-CoA mutase n=1 Tax=Nonomuraea africana TaxID=46171 RepID=A0ABR9KGK7_9ACTN|nr:methylmalonyl-CoA mutase subunit beta [Nonomuraea africana]MBE1561159.1 methylmalonyl-CoA mutase [Nonomuraea africana]
MRLAADFPSTTRDDWRALALGVLRRSGVDADPEAALATDTYDGVRLAPLYDAGDLPELRAPRPAHRGWDVRQRHAVADNEAVLADLENGVTSLWLAVPPGDLARTLRGVHLDLAPVVLEAGERTAEAAAVLLGLGAEVRGNLGAGLGADAVTLARRCAAEHEGLRAIVVDGLPYHDAGGSDTQELGCSLAVGVAHLRALTEAGLPVEQALGQLEFRYAATADQFATIAKLRAARLLWARVAEVCGGGGEQVQHAVTSSAMMTARDPHVNLLRTTLACFAAGVGGADAVTVQPFDAALGAPDAFSRRLARNIQALLLEEAGVGQVADPAGGSWYVERLTAELAERAWRWFQEIEAAGGIQEASGLVSARIAATRARREADIAHRRFPITGVSEFPNPDERPRPSTSGRVERYARPYEELRDLADAQPERPTVFLATIGPVAAHTARAAFAANLFRAGGLRTVTSGPGIDPEAIARAFAASGAAVACLCSSDQLYGEHATPVAQALRRAGARRVWLAGKGTHEGVDARLYAGCDALEVLRTTFDDLGVTR